MMARRRERRETRRHASTFDLKSKGIRKLRSGETSKPTTVKPSGGRRPWFSKEREGHEQRGLPGLEGTGRTVSSRMDR